MWENRLNIFGVCLTIALLAACARSTVDNPSPEKKIDLQKAARLNVELGLEYLESQQISRGKMKLQKAIALAPELPEVHVAFGRYYESIGEYKEADRAYQQAIGLDRRWAVSRNAYGAFLCRQGQYEKANNAFEKALEDKGYPDLASVLENAGLCELAANHAPKAKVYLERAYRQDKNRANSALELAYIYYQDKSFHEAWKLYNGYLLSGSQTPRSLYLGVKLAKVLGYRDAEASYLLLLRSEYAQSSEYARLKHEIP